jgi:hypothetical protein
MFPVGDNRALVAQRNGAGHIRGYAGWRAPETAAWDLAGRSADQVRATTLEVFDGWASVLSDMIRQARSWPSDRSTPCRSATAGPAGVASCSWATPLMSCHHSPARELTSPSRTQPTWRTRSRLEQDGRPVARAEAVIAERAKVAAEDSAEGLRAAFSSDGAARVREHYRERIAG